MAFRRSRAPGRAPPRHKYHRLSLGGYRGWGLCHTSGPAGMPLRMGSLPPPLTTSFHPWAFLTVRTSFCALSQNLPLNHGAAQNPPTRHPSELESAELCLTPRVPNPGRHPGISGWRWVLPCPAAVMGPTVRLSPSSPRWPQCHYSTASKGWETS